MSPGDIFGGNMRININDFDKELFEAAVEAASKKGLSTEDKKTSLTSILTDYINMNELANFDNPYMIKYIQQIVTSEITLLEKRLGGRLFTLLGDTTLNLSILTQIMHESMAKYDDPTEALAKMDRYRRNAVENLRNNKSPITYAQLVKDDHDE